MLTVWRIHHSSIIVRRLLRRPVSPQGITIAEMLALLISGMDLYTSSLLTFGTVGTGVDTQRIGKDGRTLLSARYNLHPVHHRRHCEIH